MVYILEDRFQKLSHRRGDLEQAFKLSSLSFLIICKVEGSGGVSSSMVLYSSKPWQYFMALT